MAQATKSNEGVGGPRRSARQEMERGPLQPFHPVLPAPAPHKPFFPNPWCIGALWVPIMCPLGAAACIHMPMSATPRPTVPSPARGALWCRSTKVLAVGEKIVRWLYPLQPKPAST
uniref:Uncharacterized protein n=1 Tax=Eutreptiella gymnastica TaxID=73025 RepID=A0A7S4CZP1_9EUGL